MLLSSLVWNSIEYWNSLLLSFALILISLYSDSKIVFSKESCVVISLFKYVIIVSSLRLSLYIAFKKSIIGFYSE